MERSQLENIANQLNEIFFTKTNKPSKKWEQDTELYNKYFELNLDTKNFIYLQLSQQLTKKVTRENIIEFMREFNN